MNPARNAPCSCGSGKKYKHCCLGKIELRPDAPSSVEFNQLFALSSAARHVELENQARALIDRYPTAGMAWKMLGESLYMQRKDALPALRKAAELLPQDADAFNNLAVALTDLGQFHEAVECCHRALKIKPDDARAHNNLGIALFEMGRIDEAVTCYQRALKIKPDYFKALNNLGGALENIGQFNDAADSYRRALAIKPEYVQGHYNLGYCLLAMAQFSAGWQEQEYRLKRSEFQYLSLATRLPQWRGQQPNPSDRLLVLEEQGMGDKLQFIRYLALAAERFAPRFTPGVSIVIGRPLRELFRRSYPQIEILETMPVDQHAWQWQCPLLSLPLAFDTTEATIPRQIPYLITDPARVAYWQNRIAALQLPATTRKIGVVWKSGTIMKIAQQKSVPIQSIAPLLNQPGCAWFSLQKEPDLDKAPWVASGKLIDWAEEFSNFDETAALAMNLDLIISVDTSVAHLAGGLGLPTWLFNRSASDWRWMRDREDSPWHPTMRIFTQKKAGQWGQVVQRMVEALSFYQTNT
jgi:Flp pilus assembly protein TadD